MRIKKCLTMLLLFFFVFTMLSTGKVMATTVTEAAGSETENAGTTDDSETNTKDTSASETAVTDTTDTESLTSETIPTETAGLASVDIETFSSADASTESVVTTTASFSTGKLKITDGSGAVKGNSAYSAYQIITFDASKNSEGKTVYTNLKLNSDYKAAIIAALGLNSSSTNYQIFTAISELNAEKTAAFAVALKAAADSRTPIYTTTNGIFNSMQYGYYLVIETANNANDGTVISKPILVGIPQDATCDPEVSVQVKTSKAEIVKKIIESGSLYDSSTAAVGDTVNYQSTSTIPTYSADAQGITYYVTDTLSAGLTFDASSVKAKIVKADGSVFKDLILNTDYTLATSNINGATFRLTLTSNDNIKTWGNLNYKLLVTYSAKLNESATYGNTGNPNSINLTYSNKPGSGSGSTTYTTPDDTVITYTTKLEITKTDGDNKPLSGATFELSIKNGNSYTVIDTQTTVNGKATFKKLEQGTYKLTETVAPSGYNLLDESIEFTVSAKNGELVIPNSNITVTYSGNEAAKNFKATWISNNSSKVPVTDGILSANIQNTKGFTLPGTGGIGTTIFTVAGVAIILLGFSMIIVYFKRMKRLSTVK